MPLSHWFRLCCFLAIAVCQTIPSMAADGLLSRFGSAKIGANVAETVNSVDISPSLFRDADGKVELTIVFAIHKGTHLYADQMQLSLPAGVAAELIGGDRPGREADTGRDIFEGGVRMVYRLTGDFIPPLAIGVTYQGCTGAMCFLPKTEIFTLDFAATSAAPRNAEAAAAAAPVGGARTGDRLAEWKKLADRFTVSRKIVGYQDADKFRDWLRGREQDGIEAFLDRTLHRWGLLAVALLLLPLGALLNLTPCVLPMVPITLGILGASASAVKEKGKGRGFALGLLYGFGMALVYGILGLAVVLTGSRFGAVNSSPWFNFAVAAVFVALALAMFDVWVLDFTGLRRVRVDNRNSPFIGAFLLGGLTALLAGACVAPVLVWVLLLAADLYAKGNALGIVLPFCLGAGMGLPWPFLAAGVSRLPRPGTWMTRVKQAFGVLILLAAVYYGWLGYRLLKTESAPQVAVAAADTPLPGWHDSLTAAFRAADASGRPLLIDFGGVACKACDAMKATTLRNPEVAAELAKMEKVEFMADGTDPFTAAVVKHYGVVGMPTYIILQKR